MIECVKLRRGLPHGKAVLTFCGTACVLHVFYADERVYISTTFYRVLLFSTTRPVLESKTCMEKANDFGCALSSRAIFQKQTNRTKWSVLLERRLPRYSLWQATTMNAHRTPCPKIPWPRNHSKNIHSKRNTLMPLLFVLSKSRLWQTCRRSARKQNDTAPCLPHARL